MIALRRRGDFETKRRREFSWSLGLVVAWSLSIAPAQAISNNAGTKNGDFLKIGTDARGVALGDSVVSMVRGADALRWNPAALGILDGKEVSATHIQYYQDVHVENISGVYPIE